MDSRIERIIRLNEKINDMQHKHICLEQNKN